MKKTKNIIKYTNGKIKSEIKLQKYKILKYFEK